MGQSILQSGHLYFDALGDAARARYVQPVYAACLVWVPRADADGKALGPNFERLRGDLGVRRNYEFHATQITKKDWSSAMPLRFFQLLRSYGVAPKVRCAEVVKTHSSLPLTFAGKTLMYELAARCLLRLPQECLVGCSLTIDDTAHQKKAPTIGRELRTYVKQAIEARGRKGMIGSIHARPAHQVAGLQLADFLAAALVKPWPICRKELENWDIEHSETVSPRGDLGDRPTVPSCLTAQADSGVACPVGESR
jgi:hypothetical protein